MVNSNKIFLLCIDGLEWSLLRSFFDEGLLPNLKEIIDGGVSGEIESLRPTISARIWASMYTGKSPEKHGIRDFYDTHILCKQVWDILNENDDRVGVFNPMSLFDIKPVNGFMIPGHMTRKTSAYPTELRALKDFTTSARKSHVSFVDWIKHAYKLNRIGCKISTLLQSALLYLNLQLSGKNVLDSFFKKKKAETRINTDVFISCLRKFSPNFVVFYDNGIDTVCHRYWKYMDPQEPEHKKYGQVIKNHYVFIDEVVGKMKSALDEDWTILLVSDHGFQGKPSFTMFDLSVNTFLKLLGLEDKVFVTILGQVYILRPKSNEVPIIEVMDAIKKGVVGMVKHSLG